MKPRTVRLRLTALYSGLFLAMSTILLVVVNLLLRHMLQERVAGIAASNPLPTEPPPIPTGGPPTTVRYTDVVRTANDLGDAALGFQWGVSAVAIAVLAVVSVLAGWWLAGRLLRPLHDITATARRLSLSNLHERIALAGPRDEVTELADTFDAMLERLERSVESQRQFAANASHELRTPLAIQRAAIQIGLDEPSPERLAQVREELLKANERAERLIDGLLILAQGERGLTDRQPVALDSVVREVADEMRSDRVLLTVDAEPLEVLGDPGLLNRLVANLLHNAVRYNHDGGTVDVGLSAEGALTVRNTGPEVPAERMGELFEPFRRLHAPRTGSGDGVGLGLSIVASIAQAHDARVTPRPNPGGGLALTVHFPPHHSE